MTTTTTAPQVVRHAHDDPSIWHEREAGQPPLGPSAAVARMREAQAFRIAVDAELKALCADIAPTRCDACTVAESCDRMLSTLLIRMLNAAVEQIGEENALIARYRADPRHARALAMHLAEHEQMINELSAHVMDWGRRPSGEVRAAARALLKHWNEAHFALHDEALIALTTGNAAH